MVVMYLSADLEAVPLKNYVRVFDGDSALIIECYLANYLLISIHNINTMIISRWYVKNLQLDTRNFKINKKHL